MLTQKLALYTTENLTTGNALEEAVALIARFREHLTPDQIAMTAALFSEAEKAQKLEKISGIHFRSEIDRFLAQAGKTGSEHTKKAYRRGITQLETWGAREGINLLQLTPGQADEFIAYLRGQGKAPATIRLWVAGCSSFYETMHRWHSGIENVFRGTKARPAKKPVRDFAIPTEAEVKLILASLNPVTAAAVAIIAFRGLRAGALPELKLTGKTFKTHSKGKDISGELPESAMIYIRQAGLGKTPFSGVKANSLEHTIAYAIKKLYRAGKVKAAYSCHDFRHFYATTEYRKDCDIHRVSKLLGHASIQVTETYLKSIDVLDSTGEALKLTTEPEMETPPAPTKAQVQITQAFDTPAQVKKPAQKGKFESTEKAPEPVISRSTGQ